MHTYILILIILLKKFYLRAGNNEALGNPPLVYIILKLSLVNRVPSRR